MKSDNDALNLASNIKIPRIEVLRAKKEKVQEKRKNLTQLFQKIEDELRLVFTEMEIFASGLDVSLEQIGEDEFAYGHLSFYNEKLFVGFRTSNEDYYHSMNNLSEEEFSYAMKYFSECKNMWLEKLSSEKSLQSLFTNLEARLDQLNDAADQSVAALKKILEHQSTEVNEDVIAALSIGGSENLLKEWSKARSSIALDPEDSITRSSSYLESICKKILADLGVATPSPDTISSLISECVKQLELSENSDANKALVQLFGSLKGIFQSIGAIRSSFGTAHGFAPDDYKMGEHYARLINNAAATASTYLLHRHRIRMNGLKINLSRG